MPRHPDGRDEPSAKNASSAPWRRFLPLIGLGLLVWLLAHLDRAAILESLDLLSPGAVATAALCFTANLALKTVRWHRMVRSQDVDMPWTASVPAFLASLFYGLVTIGRLGELMRVDALCAKGEPASRALSSLLVERGLDILLLVVLGGALTAAVLGEPRWGLLVAFGLAAAAAAVTTVRWIAAKQSGQSRTEPPATFVRRLLASLSHHGRGLNEGLRELLRARVVAESLFWTALSWLFYFQTLLVIAWSLNLAASTTTLIAATCLAALTTILPITFHGLGARELVFAAVLALEGVAFEAAVALSLVHFGVMLGCSLLSGLVGLAMYRRPSSSTRPRKLR